MFGELIESRARRQRRTGGIALSAIIHVAIIGAATASTVQGKPAPKEQPPTDRVRFVSAPTPPRTERAPVAERGATHSLSDRVPVFDIPTIDVPTTVPTHLPTIEPQTNGVLHDALLRIGHAGSSSGTGGVATSLLAGDDRDATDWRGIDVTMRILSSSKPRYPDALRQANVDGEVLVQFAVDTLGRVDMATVVVMKSTHDLFTRAVREALPNMRFKPAEVNGVRMRALAQMPFEFSLTSR